MIASAVVVFPQPDSPTSPRRWPGSSERLTPCTAWSSPRLEVEPDVEVLDLQQRSAHNRVPPATDERAQPEGARRQVCDAQPRVERIL